MEFLKCRKESLLTPLTVVSGIVERKHIIPVVANVLLTRENKKVSLTTTDIEIQIKTSLEIEIEGDDAQLTVNAKKILEKLKSNYDLDEEDIEAFNKLEKFIKKIFNNKC